MQTNELLYLRLAPAFILIRIAVFVILVIFVEILVLRYAYMQLGVSSRTALLLLFASPRLAEPALSTTVFYECPDRVARQRRGAPSGGKRRTIIIVGGK
jgi:hypothetical protein